MFQYNKKHLKTFLCFLGVLFLDQILKNVFLNWGLTQKNFHSLFGLETNLIYAGIIAITFLSFILSQRERKYLLIPTGLLLMGVISNTIDKIRFGFIIDYINLFNIFIFNIADVSIFLGTFIFIWQIIRE
jgi:lipoprotein signal peptidase